MAVATVTLSPPSSGASVGPFRYGAIHFGRWSLSDGYHCYHDSGSELFAALEDVG